ncbi:MAG: carboxypeptidase-like regulatory domain-containing protein [Deltaproteobacteria bacterium]|nr:carboxypeptidase-like regulatory domain-containing protein [Deltaproteobacteria bacterium]
MRLTRAFYLSLWALLISGLLTSGAMAHKLLVAAVVEGKNDLKVQAFFPDGSPAQEIPVTVAPADGSPPLNAQTDTQGNCRFSGLKPGAYRVEAGDPLGHRGETKIVVQGAAAAAPPAPAGTAPAAGSAASSDAPAGEAIPWINILAGLGFIFGLAAFVMVLRLKADLRRYASRD